MSQQIWIGTEPNPNDRLIITVSEADAEKISPASIDGIVEVTDVTTDKKYRVQRADCGLGCRCALELVGTKPQPRWLGAQDGTVVQWEQIDHTLLNQDTGEMYCAKCGVSEKAGMNLGRRLTTHLRQLDRFEKFTGCHLHGSIKVVA